MKIFHSFLLPFIISIILFIIPFFWLKPGEINLGGDASRLYFYDPHAFLFTNTLYGIIPSDIGGEAVSYYAFPYILLLTLLKAIFNSPTTLIAISNGLTLSLGFLFVFLNLKELLNKNLLKLDKSKAVIAASVGGIFYICSPFMMSSWDRSLLSHYQIFLNPLIFFLLLKFFITDNFRYFLLALFVTFIFSFNFSFVGAPSFFAFYPLAILFLLVYTIFVIKKRIKYKLLFVGFFLFFLLQFFHLLPLIMNFFIQDSSVNQNIFSENKILSRGRDYFIAIAPSIKLSTNFLSLLQGEKLLLINFFFFIFPLITIVGFFLNKSKLFLLTAIFFLITLFFATANITDIAFFIYKQLFYLPGFAMFRSFYGQWGYVFIFFYALLFGQALFYIFNRINYKKIFILFITVVTVLLVNAWPLFTGKLLHHIHPHTKNIDVVFEMDPFYEESLRYIKNSPADAKILTLPLSGFGYQILSGKDEGAYVGPPMSSYLAGKNDFSSYDRLAPFNEIITEFVSKKKYSLLNPFFSVLNIKYIFYNSDTYIYDSYFPQYPYEFVRDYFPSSQKEYKAFIDKLPFKKKREFGETFNFYELSEEFYFPHIYLPQKIIKTNNPIIAIASNQSPSVSFVTIDNSNKIPKFSSTILAANQKNPLADLKNNYHLHKHEPFITKRMDDLLYPFVEKKEKNELSKSKKIPNKHIDFCLFYMSKRIYELNSYGNETPLIGKEWTRKYGYFSWEANLKRYEDQYLELIDYINESANDDTWKATNRIKVNNQINMHLIKLRQIIDESNKTIKEKHYLYSLTENLFQQFSNKIQMQIYDPTVSNYDLDFSGELGEYEVYIEKNKENNDQINIEINGDILRPTGDDEIDNFINMGKIKISNKKKVSFTLHYSPVNLAEGGEWTSSKIDSTQQFTEIEIDNILKDKSRGISKKLVSIQPNTQYLITFDYKTQGANALFSFVDRKQFKEQFNIITVNEPLLQTINSTEWRKHQALITTDQNVIEAYIRFLGDDLGVSNIFIKNLTVTKVESPTIIFKKINEGTIKEKQVPGITIEKINSTKYKVHVSSATAPYFLVLSEAFSTKWKLIDPVKEEVHFISKLSKFLRVFFGLILERTGVTIKENEREEKIESYYFNGKIKEKKPQNIFLDSHTFETWGARSLPEENHVIANGYANGWYIEPNHFDGKTEYNLIIEYSSQKQFYFGLIISSCAFIFCVLIFIILTMKKRKKQNTNKFGGERLDSKSRLAKNNLLEHLARYDLVEGDKSKAILDLGCGSGHGSNLLAKKFKFVDGIDISEDAIVYAKKHWGKNNITFHTGSGTALPFKDNTFDIVASFEVFEHIKEWKKYLKEIKRVTKKGGIIYLSTPNKNIYNPWSKTPINPHHIFEMRIDEFKQALKPYFYLEKFLGQRTPVYNDHWIWKIFDPLSYCLRKLVPYKVNNLLKLKIINWIKPELDKFDIIFVDKPEEIKKSRTMIAICRNK